MLDHSLSRRDRLDNLVFLLSNDRASCVRSFDEVAKVRPDNDLYPWIVPA